MAVVKAAKVPTQKLSKRELYATVCYYYPNYDLRKAQKLPARDISLLVKTAQKIKAMEYYHLTQIAAAPHSKKGKAVSKLTKHFKKVAES